MSSDSNLRTVRVLALTALLAPAPTLALDEDDYKTASHVLALGLPAVAAGLSAGLSQGDRQGYNFIAAPDAAHTQVSDRW